MSEPFSVTVGEVRLSGRIARPAGRPRGLILALPGHGMLSGYFDGPADPDTSLLTLGAERGYAVWATDRPGYGTAASVSDELCSMHAQASFLLKAMRSVRADLALAGPAALVGHSFGFKTALAMAAADTAGLVGAIDGSGTGLHYAFDVETGKPVAAPGDLSPLWGPRRLYPSSVFRRAVLPSAPMPYVPPTEGADWPSDFRAMADRIGVPVRFTLGDHERLWRTDEGHAHDLRVLLANSPEVDVRIHPDAGHNVSLARTGRAYHEAVLDFFERALER